MCPPLDSILVERLAAQDTREGRSWLTITSEPRYDEFTVFTVNPGGKLGWGIALTSGKFPKT